jgi:dephospho-CoA kinase
VNRARLGALVFGDAQALARLEGIVHPALTRARESFLIEHGAQPLVVFDIPLLFEKGTSARSMRWRSFPRRRRCSARGARPPRHDA